MMIPMMGPTCRKCGCTDDRACVDLWGDACWWVAEDLCSACGPPDPGPASSLFLPDGTELRIPSLPAA